MAVHQTTVTIPVDNIATTDEEPSVERFDLIIRYLMTAVGSLPASCVPHLPKSAKLLLAIAQLPMVILLFIPPVNALFNSLKQEDGQDPALFIYKVLCLGVSFLTPFDALCFSVTGNMFDTFKDYYRQLAVVQKCFSKMHIDISHRLLRIFVVLLTATGVTFSCIMVALFIYDYLHHIWNLDLLFAPEIKDENYTALDPHQVRLRQLGQFYIVIYSSHVSLKITYFSFHLLVLFLLFRRYNKHLEHIVKNDPNSFQQDLLTYRLIHLELRQLVVNMNRVFRCLLGGMVLAYSIGTLLILYLVSMGLTEDSGMKGIMMFWCAMFVFLELMIFISCQLIQDQVSVVKVTPDWLVDGSQSEVGYCLAW